MYDTDCSSVWVHHNSCISSNACKTMALAVLRKLFLLFFFQNLAQDGPYLTLLGLLLASLASVITASTNMNLVSTNFQPFLFANSKKTYLGSLLPKFASDGLETIIKRSASKFCISHLRRRVQQSSLSNIMAKSIRFILMWRSRLNYMPEKRVRNSHHAL